jgi:hypothetical protein
LAQAKPWGGQEVPEKSEVARYQHATILFFILSENNKSKNYFS